jgi:hypothetical protein
MPARSFFTFPPGLPFKQPRVHFCHVLLAEVFRWGSLSSPRIFHFVIVNHGGDLVKGGKTASGGWENLGVTTAAEFVYELFYCKCAAAFCCSAVH